MPTEYQPRFGDFKKRKYNTGDEHEDPVALFFEGGAWDTEPQDYWCASYKDAVLEGILWCAENSRSVYSFYVVQLAKTPACEKTSFRLVTPEDIKTCWPEDLEEWEDCQVGEKAVENLLWKNQSDHEHKIRCAILATDGGNFPKNTLGGR